MGSLRTLLHGRGIGHVVHDAHDRAVRRAVDHAVLGVKNVADEEGLAAVDAEHGIARVRVPEVEAALDPFHVVVAEPVEFRAAAERVSPCSRTA